MPEPTIEAIGSTLELLAQRPETAEDWRPIFERALGEYVMEQRGGVTLICNRNVLKFIMTRKGYPTIETEEEERHVSRLLSHFFSRFFGPLWDGAKYRTVDSRGASINVGTDNLLALIRYHKEVG